MYIILAQALFFSFYIAYIWSRYGVLPSISDSWYTVDKGKKWMFTVVFCFAIGILQVFHADIHSLFFFSGASLCFTGAAAAFRDEKMTKIVHYAGAAGAILFAVIGLWLVDIKWVLQANLIFLIALNAISRNKLWWLEVFAFISVMLGLLEFYLK